MLSGKFEAETVSQGWAEDIDERFGTDPCSMETLEHNRKVENETMEPLQTESAIARYEDWCREPNSGGLSVVETALNSQTEVTIHSDETQDFLEAQLKILEAFKSKAVPEKSEKTLVETGAALKEREHVSEHIGPVQFNVGGIHVDADDMLQRIKVRSGPPSDQVIISNLSQDRNAYTSPEPAPAEAEPPASNVTEKYDNEQLQSFFSSLMTPRS